MELFKNGTPRWIIFSIDLGICACSLALAYLLRFNFSLPQAEIGDFPAVFSYVLLFRALSFYLSKTYQGIVRYTGSKDTLRISTIITIGTLFFLFTNLTSYYLMDKRYLMPFSIIIIDYLTTTFMIVSWRILFKALYSELTNPTRGKISVIIFGAGEAGIITKRTLDRDAGTRYKVLAFIDEIKSMEGKMLEGVSIYGFDKLHDLLKSNDVAHIIISVQNLSNARKQNIVDLCLGTNTRVLNVPPVSSWINGELSFKQIKKIRIEDLLGRDPIKLDEMNIQKQVNDKVVLVTGAAGSIGSELVRQLSKYRPAKIILLDQAESPMYDIEMELNDKFSFRAFEVVVGDIRNKKRLENVFNTFRPDIVFHAAAYKHVPLMENNPSEAVSVNILGTKIVADLSVVYGVSKFVMISTDKAVNPTNVMGASKRVAEIYVQSLGKNSETKFITTRFGNVLNSNGSVIPRFRRQIERGVPITITHPDIARYFMTIPEACQLVLEAGAMGSGGEVFIFDVGDRVRILDLAKKMIHLSGLVLGKDIQIIFTGLRPGEKLYEELLNEKEDTVIPTHHPQIMIAKVKEHDLLSISGDLSELAALIKNQRNKDIVSKMKSIVPEYKSNNSVYEILDKPTIKIPSISSN